MSNNLNTNNFKENSNSDLEVFGGFNKPEKQLNNVFIDMVKGFLYTVIAIGLVTLVVFYSTKAKSEPIASKVPEVYLDMLCIDKESFVTAVNENSNLHIVGETNVGVYSRPNDKMITVPMYSILDSKENVIAHWIINSSLACIMYLQKNNEL